MTPGVGLILGILLMLILCVIRGLWLSNRKHDGEVDFTITCPSCSDDDIKDKGDVYLCCECGLKFNK